MIAAGNTANYAVHFGTGNIGRGFIGEVLHNNGFHIDFVDVNEKIINALNDRQRYEVEVTGDAAVRSVITNVSGINSRQNPEAVVKAIAKADLVTTAIGPNVLPVIAELIAKGIQDRRKAGNGKCLDIIACENMIGGSAFLAAEVSKYLDGADADFLHARIGFPNAAVDRIVPAQRHEDPLFVMVEPFKEWVLDDSMRKARHITLTEVEYVPDLQPFIERKLFSVNSGHATAAYTGHYLGYKYINEALRDERVRTRIANTLEETGALLVAKWGFDKTAHQKYIDKTIVRFMNPVIKDEICRVARTPIRKLGRDERFSRPIRELKERCLPYSTLLEIVAYILMYDVKEDEESVRLQEMLRQMPVEDVIKTATGLEGDDIISGIAARYRELKK
jgi:mannitol-1-phosphate 5-dehydrogenase